MNEQTKKHTTRITPEKLLKQEIARKYVDDNEALLSAISWEFFSKKRQGRGYLFIHKMISVEHLAGNDFTVNELAIPEKINYFAKGSNLWNIARESEKRSGQEHEFADFYKLVDSYDPKFEFIIVVGITGVDNEAKPTEHYFKISPQIPPHKARLRN